MSAESKGAIKAALVANGLIAVMKLVGAIISGSASMLAEFKHSVGDWANGFFLLIGIYQSEKPADDRYHFGHGQRAFFWSFVASLGMLFIGGALSIYGGISKIMHPEPLEYVNINLIILGLSVFFEMFSLYKAILAICIDAGDTTKGLAALPKAFKHMADSPPAARFIFLEDLAALLGLLIAAGAIGLCVATDNTVWDGVASVIIGLMLFGIGITSAKDNMQAIVGESADVELTLKVGTFVKQVTNVKDVNKIKSMCVGPGKYLFFIIIEASQDLHLSEVDDLSLQVKLLLQEQFDEVEYAHIVPIAEDQKDDWKAHCDRLTAATDSAK